MRPPLPGVDLPGIFSVKTIPDANAIKNWIAEKVRVGMSARVRTCVSLRTCACVCVCVRVCVCLRMPSKQQPGRKHCTQPSAFETNLRTQPTVAFYGCHTPTCTACAPLPLPSALPLLSLCRRLPTLQDAKTAVVIGGGFIGLEMIENLVHRGIKTSLVEMLPQVCVCVCVCAGARRHDGGGGGVWALHARAH